MQPVVYNTKDAIIVMYGYLYDTESLQPSVWSSTPDGKGPGKHSFDFSELRAETHTMPVESGHMSAQILLQHVLFVTRNDGSFTEALEKVKVGTPPCPPFTCPPILQSVAPSRRPSFAGSLFHLPSAQVIAAVVRTVHNIPCS